MLADLDILSPHSWHNLLLAGYPPPGLRWPPLPTPRHRHTAWPYDSCISQARSLPVSPRSVRGYFLPHLRLATSSNGSGSNR